MDTCEMFLHSKPIVFLFFGFLCLFDLKPKSEWWPILNCSWEEVALKNTCTE